VSFRTSINICAIGDRHTNRQTDTLPLLKDSFPLREMEAY